MLLKLNTELRNGKYRIINVPGLGGFGITYLAEHAMLDKTVAIKKFFLKEYCDRDENTSHLTIGNILMMPLGVLNHYLTADCLTPDRLYYYFLYLGEYTHTLAKGVPVEANIWTIKE